MEEVRLRAHYIQAEGALGRKRINRNNQTNKRKNRRIVVELGGGLGVFTHHELSKAKTEDGDREKYGLFVSSEKTLTKKVRMPKNRAGQKVRKKENADSRNHENGILAGRAALNSQYEMYCNAYGHIAWKKFEKYQGGKSFQKKLKEIGAI